MELKPFEKRTVLQYGNATKCGLVMREMVYFSVKDPLIKDIAYGIVKKDGTELGILKKIFDFAYNSAAFQPDPKGENFVHSGSATIRRKFANCVDYSVLVSSLLTLLGLDHSFRIIEFTTREPDGTYFTRYHVYVVTASKIILDPVLGQDQEGENSIESRDQTSGQFNKEFYSKKLLNYKYQDIKVY